MFTSTQNKPSSKSAALPIKLQMIGCQAAGKTACVLMLIDMFFESYLSDLRISASDPGAYNKLRQEFFNRLAGFINRPMDPSLIARGLNAIVKSGRHRVLDLSIIDPVGHLLPGVTEASDDRLKQQHAEYCQWLKEANVLCIFLPAVPPNASAQDRMRFKRNMRVTAAHLDQALEERSSDSRVSVAIIGTKIDTLGSSSDEVRDALCDDHLRDCFDDIVRMIKTSDKVAHSAIIPISSCGFGTMRLLEGVERRTVQLNEDDDDTEVPQRDFVGEEAPYALRPDALPEPFNLKTLMAWCLWAGATPQLVDPDMQGLPELATAIEQLEEILNEEDSWLVPIVNHQTVS